MEKIMNFWRIKMYPGGDTVWGEDNLPWILENKGFIGMGKWHVSQEQNETFVKQMKTGDIVGVMIYDRLVALVQVTAPAVELDSERIEHPDGYWHWVLGENDNLKWLVYRRPVRVLDWNIGNVRPAVDAGRSATLVRCADLDAPSNKAIVDWFKDVRASFEKRGIAQLLD